MVTDLAPHPAARDPDLFSAGVCQPLSPADLFALAGANFIAWDDVNPALIPVTGLYVSYYGNGWAQNLTRMVAAVPHALLSPCLLEPAASPYKDFVGWPHGISVDCEPSLFTPARLANEAKKIKAAGVMPKAYGPLSMIPQIVAALNAVGLRRADVQIHAAHWTGVPHICSGVSTVWGTITCDSTQYTDKALGRSLDASLCASWYYGPWGAPKPPPPKPQTKPTGKLNFAGTLDFDKWGWSARRTPGTWKPGTEQPRMLAQLAVHRDGSLHIVGIANDTAPLGNTTPPTPSPTPTPPTPPTVTGHNPVPGWRPTRIDQGVDGTLSAAGYVAPYKCKIIRALDYVQGWRGGWLVYEILEGPFTGQGVFVAEGVKPAVARDQVVPGGTKIGVPAPNGFFTPPLLGNIETGWVAPDAGQSLARTLPGYSGDQSIQAITCGAAMNLFIEKLGGAPGHNNTTLAPDWTLLPSALRKALGV